MDQHKFDRFVYLLVFKPGQPWLKSPSAFTNVGMSQAIKQHRPYMGFRNYIFIDLIMLHVMSIRQELAGPHTLNTRK